MFNPQGSLLTAAGALLLASAVADAQNGVDHVEMPLNTLNRGRMSVAPLHEHRDDFGD